MPKLNLESVARAVCAHCGHQFHAGIAEGSFKETFLVEDAKGTRLALKVLKPGSSPERSDREVDAMRRCSHPNIAALIVLAEFDHTGQKYAYLIEEFMDGGTLEDRLQAGRLDRDETLALGELLISAVAHIAEQQLVHRDLKPANIMFRKKGGEPVVVDFGIVRDLGKTSLTKTYLGMGPGTPFFAPPEQLNNDKNLIDWRADQFALGVVLSLAHLGSHPYEEPGDDPGRTIGRVAARSGPTAKFSADIAASYLPVLEKMVASWPVNRVRTPQTLLESWKAQRDIK
jgi:serine/threonine protein kinase